MNFFILLQFFTSICELLLLLSVDSPARPAGCGISRVLQTKGIVCGCHCVHFRSFPFSLGGYQSVEFGCSTCIIRYLERHLRDIHIFRLFFSDHFFVFKFYCTIYSFLYTYNLFQIIHDSLLSLNIVFLRLKNQLSLSIPIGILLDKLTNLYGNILIFAEFVQNIYNII